MSIRIVAMVALSASALGAQASAGRPARTSAPSRRTTAAAATDSLTWPTGTFSILGYDPETGDIGGAVQSRVFSVGNGVLWAEAGVGAAATQAVVDVSYGPRAIAALRSGLSAEAALKKVMADDPDPRPEGKPNPWPKAGRQFAVIDTRGNVFAYTGPSAPDSASQHYCSAPYHCTAQGNTLAHPAVTDSMVAAFERTPGRLQFRLLAAIEAGQAAGGDRRGMQSAAMIITNVRKDCGIWLHNDIILRLQVDDSPEPIKELRRLVEHRAAQRRDSTCRNAP